jgi:transcriptional regulator with XRE-family HTH domain
MDHEPEPTPHGERRHDRPTGAAALARFVRECRTVLGMSQSEAARKSGISKTTWQNVEGGGGLAMRHLTAVAIARTLGVESDVLLQLRDGVTTLDAVRQSTRSREEVMAAIAQYATWLRVDDLLVLEEAAQVRAELRRLQRTRDGGTRHPDAP